MASPDSGTYWKSGVGWVSPGSEYYSPPPSGPDVIKITPPNTSGSFYEEKKSSSQLEPITRDGKTYLVEKGTVTQKEEPTQLSQTSPLPTPPKLPAQTQKELEPVYRSGGVYLIEKGTVEQKPLSQSPFVSPYDIRLPIPEVPLKLKEIGENKWKGPENMPISISFEKGKGSMSIPREFQGSISAGVEREVLPVKKQSFAESPIPSPYSILKVAKEQPEHIATIGGYAVAGGIVRAASLTYPPVGVAVGAYSAYQVAKSVKAVGVSETLKGFTSPESIAFIAAAGSPRKGEYDLFKVKTAGGAILKEVGAIKEGVKKTSIEVRPIGVSEYYTKNPPKYEPTVTMRGTERTQVVAKGAVADVTARVQKTAPTGLITEAPPGKGYPGTTRLFAPTKLGENVNRIVGDITKNIPKPSEERLMQPAISGDVATGSRLSPITQKLLDATDITTGIRTKINAIRTAQEAGVSIKVPANAHIRALKEAGSGKTLREASSVKGSFGYAGTIGGRIVAANMAKRLQAGGTTLFDVTAKIAGKIPDVAYTKEGKYVFVSKSRGGAVSQDMIIKAPGGWRGLKRTAVEAQKSMIAKASGLKAKGQTIINQIKQVGKQKPDGTLKYLYETYAKQNKIKASELAEKKYHIELEKKNVARFEAASKEMKSREVKTASGQSLAQKTEQEFNRADYDKPVSQMVPAQQVISVENVMPKPIFGVGNMVSGTSTQQERTSHYQPRVSLQAKAYVQKERNAQTTKQIPSLNVKPYNSQIKLSSNIPTQKESVLQKLGVEPILRQGIGSSIMQDVNVRQDIVQIDIQAPRQKQIPLLTSQQKTRQKLPPPELKLAKTFFAGSESRRIKTSVKIKQPKLLSKKGKPWRLRLATWENVSITEAATGKKAHHTFLKGKNIKKYDIQAYSQGASFRYPTAEQKRGLA